MKRKEKNSAAKMPDNKLDQFRAISFLFRVEIKCSSVVLQSLSQLKACLVRWIRPHSRRLGSVPRTSGADFDVARHRRIRIRRLVFALLVAELLALLLLLLLVDR